MTSTPVHSLTLNTGAKMPAVGLGSWFGKKGSGENEECYDMVLAALKLGYRHIDTAYGYGNENAVGRAIRDSGIPREEIFVTTKLSGAFHYEEGVKEGFELSYKALGLEYIDLYLLHWPQAETSAKEYIPYGAFPTFNDTWGYMEGLLGDRLKAIGVSNFATKNLKKLLETAKIVPAANQVESSPFLPQASLSEFCNEMGIILTAYSPLGQPPAGTNTSPILEDETIKKIAEKLGKPVGSVVLSWEVQRPGWSVVPKSANPARMKANLDIVKLDQEDFDAITAVHKQPGKLMSLCDFGPANKGWQEKGVISGWTLEQIGWDKLD